MHYTFFLLEETQKEKDEGFTFPWQ